MRIGMTGGEGFIAKNLRKMIKDPIVFDGYLDDLDKVKDFVKNTDRIYHLAGKNREKPGEIIKNNVLATSNLALAVVQAERPPEIVFASSLQVEAYPNTEYGLTKAIEEDIIKKCPRWCIYRIPNVYGPGGRPFFNSVVATFAYQIAHGEKVTINDPSVKKEFIYVGDLITELLDPIFNECRKTSGEVMSIGMIHDYLTTQLGQHEKLKRCLDYYKVV